MALDGTYSGLQASIASFLHRTDMTTVITGDLIVLAESRIANDLRLRRQVTSTTLYTVASTQTVALPSDYLEMENLSIIDGGVTRQLNYINIEAINAKYPDGSSDSVPMTYGFEGSNILLGPVPDAVYSLPCYYYARYAALSVTPANWILTNHPGVYLWGALAEAGDYVQDDSLIQKWESKYARTVKELQNADDNSMFSGAALRVRNL